MSNIPLADYNAVCEGLKGAKERITELSKQLHYFGQYVKEATGGCPRTLHEWDHDCRNRCESGIEPGCWVAYVKEQTKGETE